MKSKEWNKVTTIIRSRIKTDRELLTEKQWMTRKYVPVDTEAGNKLYVNQMCQTSTKYYFDDEVRPMNEEELALKKENDKKQRARLKQKQQELRQKELEVLDELKTKNETLKYDCIYLIDKLVREKIKELRPTGSGATEVVIDVETTGLEDTDEMLQISIIDTEGNTLFNSYIRPIFHESWPQAEEINQINIQTVKDAPEIQDVAGQLAAILKDIKNIIGYNVAFDVDMLKRFGIPVNDEAEITDVMKLFAPIYGEWSDKYGCFKWQKLTTCAAYFGFDWKNIKAHDSLADCLATLYCYKKLEGGNDNEQM